VRIEFGRAAIVVETWSARADEDDSRRVSRPNLPELGARTVAGTRHGSSAPPGQPTDTQVRASQPQARSSLSGLTPLAFSDQRVPQGQRATAAPPPLPSERALRATAAVAEREAGPSTRASAHTELSDPDSSTVMHREERRRRVALSPEAPPPPGPQAAWSPAAKPHDERSAARGQRSRTKLRMLLVVLAVAGAYLFWLYLLRQF
jgi:hypothetical protein